MGRRFLLVCTGSQILWLKFKMKIFKIGRSIFIFLNVYLLIFENCFFIDK